MSDGAIVDTIVEGGTIVTGVSAFEAAIAIDGERIVAVGPRQALPEARETIDATNQLVFPGAIDCHTHLNLDGWRRGSEAAARAGVTTMIPFVAYHDHEQETLPAAIERMRGEVEGELYVDVSLNFILHNTPYIFESIPDAVRDGVCAFKMFMTYKRGRLYVLKNWASYGMNDMVS